MDNPHDFSPVESTVEPINDEAPSAPVETVPSGIEWGAMALGFGVGIIWWLSQRAFSYFLFSYLDSGNGVSIFSRSWFYWVWLAFSLVLSFGYGLTVGFVVGYRARHQHHRFTTIVIVLLFALTFISSIVLGSTALLSFHNLALMGVSFLLSLAGALNGVYLAKSVKRNRGVRIQ
jgi:hypothetical protein